MKRKTLTYEEINKFEDLLRIAQDNTEAAGVIMCNEPGDTEGGQLWRDCNKVSELLADMIHRAYLAGPDGKDVEVL